MRADPDDVGELVNAFLTDQRRIHVGHHQPFGAGRQRLHDEVGDQLMSQRQRVPGDGRVALEHDIRGDAGLEPAGPRHGGQGLRDPRERGIAQRRFCGIDDKRGDMGRHGHSGQG